MSVTPTSSTLEKIMRDYGVSKEMANIIFTLQYTPSNKQHFMEKMMKGFSESQCEAGEYSGLEFSVLLQYEGFDPKMILAMVLMRVGSDKARQNDIYKLIQIGLERGNNITNIIKSSSPEFTAVMRELKTAYCLKDKAGKNKMAITLSRICMVFPFISCSYMACCKNPTVSRDKMNSIVENYPTHMMTGAYAGTIYTDGRIEKHLRNAYLVHQYEFNQVINRKNYAKKRPSQKEIISDLIKFADAAINGNFIPNESRLACQIQWGLIIEVVTKKSRTLKVSKPVLEASNYWLTKYQSRIVDDTEGDDAEAEDDDEVGGSE